MIRNGRGSTLVYCSAVLILAGALACSIDRPGSNPDLLKLRVGSFTFASLASVMAHIIQQQGIDKLHGLEVEVVPYGSVTAYYAGLTSGEVDTIAGGPLVFQLMRLQGVPIQITNTYATMASLLVLSADPAIHDLLDLRKTRLAADLGSSEYQILRVLAQRKGLHLGSEVEVLQASPTVARAHLQSGEAQAILTFEPNASLILKEIPGAHVVSRAQDDLFEIGMDPGWFLVSIMRADWISRHPAAPTRWQAALTAAAAFVRSSPVEADRIFSKAANFPSGVLLAALQEGRVEFLIRSAQAEKESLLLLFKLARESGFAGGIPEDEAFYQ